MKFILTISLCSFINNTCLPPVEINKEFNSWNECVVAALDLSKNIIVAQEPENVNSLKIATKFICTDLELI